MDARALLAGVRVVPVVVIDDVATAVPLAETLCDAGLTAVEVTLRTSAALDAIEQIATHVPQALVGAGSVRSEAQFAQISAAGARFAVGEEVMLAAQPKDCLVLPGDD